MKRVKFENSWEKIFRKAGLTTFEDFFNFEGGQIINRNSRRNVTVFELEGDKGSVRFFMKRFEKPHFKDMLAALNNFGVFCSQADVEWKNAQKLLSCGIPTYRPVCYGHEMTGPIEKRSFFITKELDGTSLDQIVANKWKEMQKQEKLILLEKMAELAAKAHKEKLSMPDLYVWHYWVEQSEPDYVLGKIDLHMTEHRVGINRQIRDLGALHYSMTDKYFSNDEREYLFDKYFEITGLNKSRIMKKVLARSAKVRERRKEPRY